MISADVILHSVSPQGIELLAIKARYPKFIHGELMTHRVFSRNASSSRAVPTAKLLEEVRTDALRAGPVWWGKNQPGMQADAELSDDKSQSIISEKERAQDLWARAAREAANYAEAMLKLGVHKQIANRVLEPFSHINVLISSTHWDNFFGLRLDKAAQPEMRALAEAMWVAKKASVPRLLNPGQWHLPFIDEETSKECHDRAREYHRHIESGVGLDCSGTHLGLMQKVSVARCARVSYESFETGKRSTIDEDLKLFDRLVGSHPMHASPAEHQATPDETSRAHPEVPWLNGHLHGNFRGWKQLRKMLTGESCAPLPEGYA